jgi:uncharacterized membrane protein SpoIIM required for sporulation
MNVTQLLEARRKNWHELDEMCAKMESRRQRRRLGAKRIVQFGALYRAACADLALADAYELPPNTVHYLHQLVGRAHNQIYRSRTFRVSTWFHEAFMVLPQKLFLDRCMWLSFSIFWGTFLIAMFLSGHWASPFPDFAEALLGEGMLNQMKEMYAEPVTRSVGEGGGDGGGVAMANYVHHNAGIGLNCFAGGLLVLPGIFILAFNGTMLGAVFGYMSRQEEWDNFSRFVTAHGAFELSAVVLSGAAGLKLGFSWISTKGLSRSASLRNAGKEVVPIMCIFVVMFVAAAMIEGFLSPSAAPYWSKKMVAIGSCAVLMFYFAVLGFPKGIVVKESPLATR